MGAIKTAISIEKELFEQAEEVARSMNVSRSRLFVIALQKFIEQQKNREMLEQINAAYAEEPDDTEKAFRRSARAQHRRLLEDEW